MTIFYELPTTIHCIIISAMLRYWAWLPVYALRYLVLYTLFIKGVVRKKLASVNEYFVMYSIHLSLARDALFTDTFVVIYTREVSKKHL